MYCILPINYLLEGEKQEQQISSSAGASASATGGDELEPVDPFLALMNEESKRLQSKIHYMYMYMFTPSINTCIVCTCTPHPFTMLSFSVMLESRGLPPHLLGSLGSRMPHFFQKHMSSTNS